MDAVKDAVQRVKDHAVDTKWCLGGYTDDSTELKLLGEGAGPVDDLVALMNETGIYYGLVRETENIGIATTTKFVFVSYVGSKFNAIKRAQLSTQRGSVVALFQPFSTDLMATEIADISADAIKKLTTAAAGTAQNVMDADAGARDKDIMFVQGKRMYTNEHRRMSSVNALKESQVEVPPEVYSGIAQVRLDADPTNWTLCSYDMSSPAMRPALVQVGIGSGGPEEMATHLNDDNVFYALVRQEYQIDRSKTTKFIFVSFIGDAVPMVRKGQISTHKGSISTAFEPFSAELLNATSLDDVTTDAITKLIADVSFTSEKVKDASSLAVSQQDAATPEKDLRRRSSTKEPPRFSFSAPTVSCTDRSPNLFETPETQAAMADLRADNSATSWVVVGYDESYKSGRVVAAGEGGPEEMAGHFAADIVCYGIVRFNHVIDGHNTVKFVMAQWIGEGVPPLKKAKASSHKGQAVSFLSPFHAEMLNVTDTSELTLAAATRLVDQK